MSTTTITRRRAVKYRMYPTKEQANLIDRTMPLSSMAIRKADERYEHVGQAIC